MTLKWWKVFQLEWTKEFDALQVFVVSIANRNAFHTFPFRLKLQWSNFAMQSKLSPIIKSGERKCSVKNVKEKFHRKKVDIFLFRLCYAETKNSIAIKKEWNRFISYLLISWLLYARNIWFVRSNRLVHNQQTEPVESENWNWLRELTIK